jgi:hypothetical protein
LSPAFTAAAASFWSMLSPVSFATISLVTSAATFSISA